MSRAEVGEGAGAGKEEGKGRSIEQGRSMSKAGVRGGQEQELGRGRVGEG